MSEKSGIDELKELNRQLAGLLDDPQPGLFTWKEALSACCLDIGDFAGIGYVSAMPDLLGACKAAVQDSLTASLHGTGGLTKPVRAKLVAAIAKAEPQPPEEP